MNMQEMTEFDAALSDVFELYGKALSERQCEMWFRLLREHSLQTVRDALDAHVKDQARGRFCPMPADVLAQIEKSSPEWMKGVR